MAKFKLSSMDELRLDDSCSMQVRLKLFGSVLYSDFQAARVSHLMTAAQGSLDLTRRSQLLKALEAYNGKDEEAKKHISWARTFFSDSFKPVDKYTLAVSSPQALAFGSSFKRLNGDLDFATLLVFPEVPKT